MTAAGSSSVPSSTHPMPHRGKLHLPAERVHSRSLSPDLTYLLRSLATPPGSFKNEAAMTGVHSATGTTGSKHSASTDYPMSATLVNSVGAGCAALSEKGRITIFGKVWQRRLGRSLVIETTRWEGTEVRLSRRRGGRVDWAAPAGVPYLHLRLKENVND